jgi:hypothetical protein
MKTVTREWLNRAEDDLTAAELLLTQSELTNNDFYSFACQLYELVETALEESQDDSLSE